MTLTDQTLEDMTVTINQEIHVKAPLDVTFAALLEQLGPGNETPAGESLHLKIEPWPGGRWYRDLGDGNGHLWAHVQAIKRPTLLEFNGPLFASFPLINNAQYRAADGGAQSEHAQGLGPHARTSSQVCRGKIAADGAEQSEPYGCALPWECGWERNSARTTQSSGSRKSRLARPSTRKRPRTPERR